VNLINTKEDIYNVMLVKDYIDKHYIIYRIYADRVMEKRFPLSHDFSIREIESEKQVDLWSVERQLLVIFGVEAIITRQAFKEVVMKQIEKDFEKQIKLKFF
jgi:hypothetical protein